MTERRGEKQSEVRWKQKKINRESREIQRERNRCKETLQKEKNCLLDFRNMYIQGSSHATEKCSSLQQSDISCSFLCVLSVFMCVFVCICVCVCVCVCRFVHRAVPSGPVLWSCVIQVCRILRTGCCSVSSVLWSLTVIPVSCWVWQPGPGLRAHGGAVWRLSRAATAGLLLCLEGRRRWRGQWKGLQRGWEPALPAVSQSDSSVAPNTSVLWLPDSNRELLGSAGSPCVGKGAGGPVHQQVCVL